MYPQYHTLLSKTLFFFFLFSATLNPREENFRGSKVSLVDSEDGKVKKTKTKDKKKDKKPKAVKK